MKMNKPKKKPVTEEVKKWSIDFMKSVETEGYESMVSKLNELSPELRVGVLDYLQRVTDYCVKHSMNDHLEGVNTYKDLINFDEFTNRRDIRKVDRKLMSGSKESKKSGMNFKLKEQGVYSHRRERRKRERELLKVG